MKWEEKKSQLRQLVEKGLSDIDIAKFYNTTTGAIENARRRLGISRKKCIAPSVSNGMIDPKELIKFCTPEELNDLKEGLKVQWAIEKTKVGANKNRPFKSYLVVADAHVPYQNNEATRAVLKLTQDLKPDGFIVLGDFMDMQPISHWNKTKKKTLEGRRLKQDYIIGNSLLDEFDKRLPKNCQKQFFYGNHERFYYDFIEEYPSLEGIFDPAQSLLLKERGYIVHDDINHVEKLGKLHICHGIYTVQNFVKKHIDEFKTNVLFGHLHSPRSWLEASSVKEIAIAGYCVGCLCDLNPEYMKNKPHKWAHGVAVVYVFPDDYFHVNLIRIVKGRFVFDGRVYDGNQV